MVQIDLKKLREMQEKKESATDTPTNNASNEVSISLETEDVTVNLSSPDTQDTTIGPNLASEAVHLEEAPDVSAEKQEEASEGAGSFKINLGELHKKLTDDTAVITRQEREKELSEVFSTIAIKETPSVPLVEDEEKSQGESTQTVAQTNNGFFPGLSFIPTTPVAPPQEEKKEEPTSTEAESPLTANDKEASMAPTESTSTIDTPTPEEIINSSLTTTPSDETILGIVPSESNAITTSEPSTSTPLDKITEEVETALPPTPEATISSPTNTDTLHPTNKKSLKIVIGAFVFIALSGASAGTWVYLSRSSDPVDPAPVTLTPAVTQGGETVSSGSSMTDTQTGSILTGSTMSGSSLSGSTLSGTTMSGSSMSGVTLSGSTQTGSITQSGSIKGGSGSTTMTGATMSGSSLSGATKPVSGSGISLTGATSSGATKLTDTTSTGAIRTNSGSTSISQTGSTQNPTTPKSNPKYQEGKDYKVYGGGYKLIRNH